MDKIKQNKNYCLVYKSLSIIVCVMMLFSIMVMGAYADTELPESSNSYTEPVEINKLDQTGNITSSTGSLCSVIGHWVGVDYNKLVAYTDSDDVYCVEYGNGVFLFGSPNQFFLAKAFYNTSSGDINRADTYNATSYNEDYNLYYVAITISTNWATAEVPEYSTIDEGLTVIRYTIDQSLVTGYEFTYSLPAGNVLILDVTNLNPTIYLSMSTPTLEFQVTSTQYYGMISEIPNPVTLPISGTTPINWTAYGKKDPFGRASQWTASETVSGITSDHNHAYFVIANPFSNNYTSANGSELVASPNTTISVHVTNCNYGKIYQLNESFNAGTFNNTQAGDTMSVTYNTDTGTWDTINDTTGEADAPVYGGNNQGETAINSVSDWLENISNKISSFFTGPIKAVGTLVGAGSNFFRTLSGLYSWLPSPVLSVLTSALIVVITVGVIKVFI